MELDSLDRTISENFGFSLIVSTVDCSSTLSRVSVCETLLDEVVVLPLKGLSAGTLAKN